MDKIFRGNSVSSKMDKLKIMNTLEVSMQTMFFLLVEHLFILMFCLLRGAAVLFFRPN